jgi:hypothetical protein
MPVTVTEAERASFLRCGRQWDLAAGMRQNARQNIRQNPEPANSPAAPDLERAIRDALAVYYFPGMWDWDNGVRLPLVGQELDRTLTGEARDEARDLLERYTRWAPQRRPVRPGAGRDGLRGDRARPGRRRRGHGGRRADQVPQPDRPDGGGSARRLLDRAPPPRRRGLAGHRAVRRRPLDPPAPADVRPGPGARPGQAGRAAHRPRVPPHLAAPYPRRRGRGAAPPRFRRDRRG